MLIESDSVEYVLIIQFRKVKNAGQAADFFFQKSFKIEKKLFLPGFFDRLKLFVIYASKEKQKKKQKLTMKLFCVKRDF